MGMVKRLLFYVFWFTRKMLPSAKEFISEILGLIRENDRIFRGEVMSNYYV